MIPSRYLITPPALWDDPPVDDFPGLPLPDSDDGDAPWLPSVDVVTSSGAVPLGGGNTAGETPD